MLISQKKGYFWMLTVVLSVFVISGCSKDTDTKNNNNNNSFANSIVEENKSEAIMELFTKKYDRSSEDFVITIHKETDDHIRGSAKFNEEPDKTYLFLAAKQDGKWQLVFEGDEAVPCDVVDGFNFPEDMISDCYVPPAVVEVDYQEIDTANIVWRGYENDVYGYTVEYPSICNVLSSDQSQGVQFSGPLRDNEHWPMISISHYNSQYYKPAVGTDVYQWVKQFPGFTKGEDVTMAGLPTVHFVQARTPHAYAGDYYYFIKGDQLFNISILHTADKVDWNLYNQFLNSFAFIETENTDDDGLETEPIIEQPNLEGQIACVSDEDCVPLPGCHPHQCINADFIGQYEQPEICTLQFDCSAAYNAEDCLCQEGICVNINLTQGCKE